MSAGAAAPPLGARIAGEARVVAALGRRSVRQAFRRPQFLAPIIVFPSLFLAVNTGGAGRAVDLPEFPPVNGFLDFQLFNRNLVDGTAIGHHRPFGAKPEDGANAVHRGKALLAIPTSPGNVSLPIALPDRLLFLDFAALSIKSTD